MASNRNRRIAKEIADIHADSHSQVTADPVGGGDDLTHLRGSFRGPPGTPYDGGTYFVDIKIPNEYPFRPPIMKFETKVWHPNVSSQTVSITTIPHWIYNYLDAHFLYTGCNLS
jgi:ubiquitin-conjugating enzyme (huntingtin interacting protein 2)